MCSVWGGLCLLPVFAFKLDLFSLLRTNNEVEHHLSSKGGGRGEKGRGGTGVGNDSGYRYRVEKKKQGTRHGGSVWQSQHLGGLRQEDRHE